MSSLLASWKSWKCPTFLNYVFGFLSYLYFKLFNFFSKIYVLYVKSKKFYLVDKLYHPDCENIKRPSIIVPKEYSLSKNNFLCSKQIF